MFKWCCTKSIWRYSEDGSTKDIPISTFVFIIKAFNGFYSCKNNKTAVNLITNSCIPTPHLSGQNRPPMPEAQYVAFFFKNPKLAAHHRGENQCD